MIGFKHGPPLTTEERALLYQQHSEWLVVVYNVIVMTLVGWAFGFVPPNGVFFMANDLKIPALTIGLFYVGLSFGGVALSLCLLHPKVRAWPSKPKRRLYLLSVSALIVYTMPVAFIAIALHTGMIFSVIIYAVLYFGFLAIARLLYRD